MEWRHHRGFLFLYDLRRGLWKRGWPRQHQPNARSAAGRNPVGNVHNRGHAGRNVLDGTAVAISTNSAHAYREVKSVRTLQLPRTSSRQGIAFAALMSLLRHGNPVDNSSAIIGDE